MDDDRTLDVTPSPHGSAPRPGTSLAAAPLADAPQPGSPQTGMPQTRRADRLRERKRRLRPTRAAALFGPVALSRRHALGAAAIAAAAGGVAAMALRTESSAELSVGPQPSTTGGAGSGSAAAAGSSSGAGSARSASASAAARAGAGASPVAVAPDLDPEHLMRRVTYGPTDAMRADVSRLGLAAWLGRQLAPSSLADPGGDAVGALYPRLGWSIARAAQFQRGNGDEFFKFQLEVPFNLLGRAVWSSRQLFEVMVDFWSNHLNIPAPGDKGSVSRHRYDAEVVRAHALGRFEDMLVASSVHPAMLDYLDNASSTGREPNENYARELMELHTLGVRGGYTERDVKQAALLLTGWELHDGVATFTSARHHPGPVTILGVTHRNGSGAAGRRASEQFVRALANHPSTARQLARKLAIRFVADDPPAALVDRLAATYLAARTSVVPVLRELFGSPEFAAAGSLKVRRPMERLVATARTLGVRLGTDPHGMDDLYHTLEASGHKPLAWAMPNGYPDVAAAWQSPAAALDQLNVGTALVHGWWPKKLDLPGPAKLVPKPPRTRTEVIDKVGRTILGRTLTTQERAGAAALLSATPLPSTFGAGSWEQQESMALVATLMLSSPAFLTR